MTNKTSWTTLISTLFFFLICSAPTTNLVAAEDHASIIKQGKKIAFSRKKGNCLACHAIEGGSLPGNIGPPLINMRDRYPDKEQLHAQIWNATSYNATSIMPPFGKHEILTRDELDKVVEFVYSL